MGSGERTKLLLVQVLEYSGKYRPLTPINKQIELLFALFEADGPWRSRILEALKGRAGGLTETRLLERAEKLDLLPPDSSLRRNRCEATRTDEEYIDRLRSLQRIAPADQAEAIEWALRYVTSDPK